MNRAALDSSGARTSVGWSDKDGNVGLYPRLIYLGVELVYHPSSALYHLLEVSGTCIIFAGNETRRSARYSSIKIIDVILDLMNPTSLAMAYVALSKQPNDVILVSLTIIFSGFTSFITKAFFNIGGETSVTGSKILRNKSKSFHNPNLLNRGGLLVT
ncbi:hypothetical protein RRG08_017482 [Elysia crispata]|uniref:Uncharacterized protein n=1 Tax=Elysia crispata TaxID=231223 RepID=A0AAE1CZ57_9GAST|nr:hypothetical protein RRG08_017482 [Elysia crispata]